MDHPRRSHPVAGPTHRERVFIFEPGGKADSSKREIRCRRLLYGTRALTSGFGIVLLALACGCAVTRCLTGRTLGAMRGMPLLRGSPTRGAAIPRARTDRIWRCGDLERIGRVHRVRENAGCWRGLL